MSPSRRVFDKKALKTEAAKVTAAEPRSFAPDDRVSDDGSEFPPGAGIETLWRGSADRGGSMQPPRRGWLARVFR